MKSVGTNQTKKNILVRLSRIEGQIRGVKKMIEGDKSCEAILTQISAVRSGLAQATSLLLRLKIRECKDVEEVDGLLEKISRLG